MTRLTYNSISRFHVVPLFTKETRTIEKMDKNMHSLIFEFVFNSKETLVQKLMDHMNTLSYIDFLEFVASNNQPSSMFRVVIERPIKTVRRHLNDEAFVYLVSIDIVFSILGTYDNACYKYDTMKFVYEVKDMPEIAWLYKSL
uniref:Uncharacterized protein n=1 Tax=viral metagenome TaxID=1070528 RepID=A0A6C0CQF8_9ZZZZ